MRGQVAQTTTYVSANMTAHMRQVCNQARRSAQHMIKIVRKLLPNNLSATPIRAIEKRADYLTAYKASIGKDASSRYTGSSLSKFVKEPKRKVELLDEMSLTKLHIDELVNWFAEFGKDGILISAHKENEDGHLSDAA